MTALQRLPAHDDEGNVRVVVEAPRGSTVKLECEPKLGGVFASHRALQLGRTVSRGGDG